MQLSCNVKARGKPRFSRRNRARNLPIHSSGGSNRRPLDPKLGATDLGYRLARQFGLKSNHRTALVPLTFDADHRRQWCDLAGVAAEVNARFGGHSFREQMLITTAA